MKWNEDRPPRDLFCNICPERYGSPSRPGRDHSWVISLNVESLSGNTAYQREIRWMNFHEGMRVLTLKGGRTAGHTSSVKMKEHAPGG